MKRKTCDNFHVGAVSSGMEQKNKRRRKMGMITYTTDGMVEEREYREEFKEVDTTRFKEADREEECWCNIVDEIAEEGYRLHDWWEHLKEDGDDDYVWIWDDDQFIGKFHVRFNISHYFTVKKEKQNDEGM